MGTVPMGRRCGDGRVDGARFGDHGLSALRGTQWGQHRAVAELSAPSCTKMCTDPICSAAHLGNGSKSTVGLHPRIVCPWLMLSQPGLTPPPGAAGWWWWWWEGAELCPGFTMRWHCNGGSAATECSHCTAPCFPALLPGPALQPCSAPRAFGPLMVWRWLWGRMEVEAALYVCVYVFFFPIPFELFLSSFPSPALIVGRAVRLQVPPLCCFGAVPLWGHCTAHPTELLVSPHTRRSPPAFPPLHPRDQPSAKPRLPALDLDTEQALI